MQEIKAEEEAMAASAKKTRDATPSVFVEPHNEGPVPAGVASHVSKYTKIVSSKKGGDSDVVNGFKQERENSFTGAEPCVTEGVSPTIPPIPVPTAPTSVPITSRETVVTSGPYAGLLSAGKRRRDNAVTPFAPPKRQHRQSGARISS